MVTRAISTRRTGRQPTGCLAVFFLIFLAVGAAGSYFTLVRPLSKLVASRSWTERRCTVLSSQVTEVSDSDGSTYKVDIRYTWSTDGIAHQSNRYDFMIGSSSGRDRKQAIVDRYPPGAEVPCWVDPADPAEAVLSRGLSPVYLIGLLPLLFFAVGAAGLVWTVRSGRTAAAAATGAGLSPFGVPLPAAGSAPAELRAAVSPIGMFLVLVFVALFWNGIISVFVWQAAAGWKNGHADGCLTAFLIPFVLVGAFLIFAVGRQFLVMFNPRPRITLTPGVLRTGESAFLQWRLGSGGRGVQRVRITFEGREEAQYRRGTDTHTDRHTFLTLPVVDSSQPIEIANGGSASFVVPAGTVPSFRAEHNKVIWSLKVQCEIPRWPDSEEEYEVVVQPGGSA